MKIIHDLPIQRIHVGTGRLRKEFKAIEELAESIKLFGLLQPIILDADYNLIAGERRLRAHCLLHRDSIDAVIYDQADTPVELIEITENIAREDFTWQERAIAVKRFQELLSSENKPSTMRQVSNELGLSLGAVQYNLKLAEQIEENPTEFKDCMTLRDALKRLKYVEIKKTQAMLDKKRGRTSYLSQAEQYVKHGSCIDLICQVPKHSIDAIIADPVYGIDYQNTGFLRGDRRSGFDDDPMRALTAVEEFIANVALHDFLKPDAWVIMFCGFEHLIPCLNMWKDIGFNMAQTPGIWLKESQGRVSNPMIRLGKRYEFFIYGHRGNATLLKQGLSDVLEHPRELALNRQHITQKPISLMEDLISRVVQPGQHILDFMCGSGSTLVAAINKGVIPLGFELDEENYKVALNRVMKAIEEKNIGG